MFENDVFVKENRQLEAKLNEYEQEIDSLHGQINEQQKMDSQERIREQHENYIQSLRNKYENDLLGLREKICQYEADIYKKNEHIKLMQSEMSVTGENLEKALYDKAETVNRMTQNLNDLQAKHNKELMIFENNKM
jgi:chromosome segregation ATPase